MEKKGGGLHVRSLGLAISCCGALLLEGSDVINQIVGIRRMDNYVVVMKQLCIG